MKNIKIIFYVLALCCVACDDFVEVDRPASQLDGATVFEDRNTANAAMADIYSKLRDTGVLSGGANGTTATMGLYADELVYYGFGGDAEQLFNDNLVATSGNPADLWASGYHIIYCANAVIEGVAQSSALSDADKAQFTGEALFVRALLHFYLANIYGDVPYITTTYYEVNRLATRKPIAEVYDSMIADANEAVTLLPEDYMTPDRARPNKAVAHALLARMYLYNNAWAEAANEASAVINNPLYTWEPDLNKVFLKESPATIWQFAPKLDGGNADEGALFIFFTGPPPFVSLNPALVNAFEPGDQRKVHWVNAITDGTDTWYHAYKYKQNGITGTSLEYSVIFRLPEMYLVRAEARAHEGDLIGAKEDLDKVRNTAGLPDTPAVNADEIADAVINERRFEFFTEYGHRFFDLKRTGKLDAVLSPAKPGWNHNDALWPLPQSELTANPNLTPQNPGY